MIRHHSGCVEGLTVYSDDDEICTGVTSQMCTELHAGLHGNMCYFCLIVTKTEMGQQSHTQFFNFKLH
jgi:hypothetical protein